MSKKKYRQGVIAIIISQDNDFLVVQLNGYSEDQWNFVGGGREGNETEEENLEREIFEELGIGSDDFEIVARYGKPLKYDFPPGFKKSSGTEYDGQEKQQFIVKLNCDKSKLIILEDEIRQYKWVSFRELKDHLIFPNQYQNTIEVILSVYPEFGK